MWIFLFGVVVLVVVAVIVSYPLVFHRLEPYAHPDVPEEPFNERDALLDALGDLESSHRAGKLSDADYATQKARLELRYIEVVEAEGAGGGHASS